MSFTLSPAILAKQEGQSIAIEEWLNAITDWKSCIKLTQFILLKLSQEAIKVNAGELALMQTMDHEGQMYHTRLSIQYSKHDEKSLEERAEELASQLIEQNAIHDIRGKIKLAVLAGYNLHKEDFEEE